jgi:hypothetical protein
VSPARQESLAKDGPQMKRHLDRIIHSLVMIRLGQELGTDSEIAQALAGGIDFLAATLARLFA